MRWACRSYRPRSDDDGWLDLLIFRDPGPFKALYYLWKVFRGTHLDLPSVFHRRVKKAFVTADDTVPIQIDGDPGGFLSPNGAERRRDRMEHRRAARLRSFRRRSRFLRLSEAQAEGLALLP